MFSSCLNHWFIIFVMGYIILIFLFLEALCLHQIYLYCSCSLSWWWHLLSCSTGHNLPWASLLLFFLLYQREKIIELIMCQGGFIVRALWYISLSINYIPNILYQTSRIFYNFVICLEFGLSYSISRYFPIAITLILTYTVVLLLLRKSQEESSLVVK